MSLGLPQAHAQETRALTLDAARSIARESSPTITAQRAAVDAAAARSRQARAFPNPAVFYGREQTSGDGVSTHQNVVSLDQRIEIGGQRATRAQAARLRHEVAQAELERALLDLNLEVTRVYVAVSTTSRRASLASQAAAQFAQASQIMQRRLQQGDVSGYEVRRVRLEAARYAALAAEAQLAERDARLRLNTLTGRQRDTALVALQQTSGAAAILAAAPDSLIQLAFLRNAELRVADLHLRAAIAERSSASRERVPTPVLSAGYKNEQTTTDEQLDGLVLGVSVSLPLWDRRSGVVQAASAEVRRLEAERDAVRRRLQQTIAVTAEAVASADRQVAALQRELGAEAQAALRAAEIAFSEGEITLLAWLDAVRAYQEAEAAYTTVLAESYNQRAMLERLLGVPLIQ